MKLRERERFSQLENAIGLTFRNKKLLQQALTHKSYPNERRDRSVQHNERLEFLGDAALEWVITQYLYNHYPDKQEGELTNMRLSIVNNAMGSCGEKRINTVFF